MEIDDRKYTMGGDYRPPLLGRFFPGAGVPAGTYPLEVVDVSFWQGVIDMPKLASKANAILIRGGYGNDGLDLRVTENVNKAKAAGLPWGVYWYVKVGKDHKKHVDSFASVYANLGGDLPPVWDIEYTEGDKTATGNWLEKLIKTWQDKVGVAEMIYTRASWWDSHTYRSDWPKTRLLHVAQYTSAAQPTLPKDWTEINQPRTWTLWQWSADGNDKGAEYGVQSDDIDRNRFNGNEAEFVKTFGVKPHYPEAPPPPPPPPTGSLIYTNKGVMNIRSGPGTNYKVVGSLPAASQVPVLDIGGKEAWIQVEPGRWVAVFSNGVRYLDRV